jgi:hypothetical protein
MATRPKVQTLTNSAVDVLNVIRNNASVDFRNYVPVATADADSIRTIGAIIMDYPALQNEFLSALVNRIALVIITSKMYSNPLSVLKKGVLEVGETVEEIFVNLAKPFTFDPDEAEEKLYKREIPDVKSAFHILNYKKFYKVTISDDQLRQAFLSWAGISDLIAKIVESMYTAAEYDELEVTKYLIARQILDGRVYAVTIPETTTANMKSVVSTVKGVSNKFTFMNSNYNVAGVKTHTLKNEQYIIMNANFDATMDVEVLASAFNMDKAQFMGNRLMIDGFGTLDTARLAELFAGDSTYQEISQPELEALDKIPCILIDRDYTQIYDNMYKTTEQYNGQGLYWNYFYHVWKTFSVSPFSQAVVFVPAIPSVTSVTVTPSTATVSVGQTVQLTAKVVTENFAPQSVTWESDSEFATVTAGGLVTILDGATGTINITAKSTFNPDISGQSVLTVG